ncbi:hypothetical protein HY358_00365 [Candidatus Roizmanbacteria bacterium]|nr:hypothetical protein [Candidatus Roizmanbacteria bacterium]
MVVLMIAAFPVMMIYYYWSPPPHDMVGAILILIIIWMIPAVLHGVWEWLPSSGPISLAILKVLWNKWVYGAFLIVSAYLILDYGAYSYSSYEEERIFGILVTTWLVFLAVGLLRVCVSLAPKTEHEQQNED